MRPTTLARLCSPGLGAPLVECAVGTRRRQLRAWSLGHAAAAWAGEVVVPVCIDLSPTAMSACRATVQGREGQGQPKAAPHGDVHQVGCKGGCCVRRNCRKPHTSVRTGLRVEEGASGRRPKVTRVFERKCEVRERRVAANLGFLGRVHPQRPARRRRVRKTPTPVCSSSPPPRAGAQPPQLRVGKALPVRPRALALAGLLRRGIVRATPGAHRPTPPSMLPVIPAPLPKDRGLPGSAAKKRPAVVSLAGSLVAEQAFNYRPDRIVVTTSVRQDVGWGYVAEQMLCTRRRAESRARRTGHQGAA
eukprot:s33_g30.t1